MLHEGGNARCLPGRDKCANFFNLIVLKRDRDLRGCHTKYHTMQTWAVKVSGNWRVTFIFAGGDVDDVDYEDYH